MLYLVCVLGGFFLGYVFCLYFKSVKTVKGLMEEGWLAPGPKAYERADAIKRGER